MENGEIIVFKSVFIGAGLILLSACQAQTTAEPAATTFDMPHIKRPNILVADLDRSLAIYQDILGFSPGSISESSLDSFSYPVFNLPPEARMRYTYLGEPGEDRIFGITEVRNIDLPKPASAPYMSTVVIGISGLTEKFAKLEALGLAVTASKIAEGTEFTFIEQAFMDPDGHLIVCYEILTD